MKQYPVNVTEHSINLIKEFKNYKWKEHPDDSTVYLNIPVDNFNHAIDGARYSVVSQFRGHGGRKARYANDIKMKTGIEKYNAF